MSEYILKKMEKSGMYANVGGERKMSKAAKKRAAKEAAAAAREEELKVSVRLRAVSKPRVPPCLSVSIKFAQCM